MENRYTLMTSWQRFNPSQPISTTLFANEATVEFTARMAKLLARKSNMPVYVGNSCSFSNCPEGGTVEEEMDVFQRIAAVVADRLVQVLGHACVVAINIPLLTLFLVRTGLEPAAVLRKRLVTWIINMSTWRNVVPRNGHITVLFSFDICPGPPIHSAPPLFGLLTLHVLLGKMCIPSITMRHSPRMGPWEHRMTQGRAGLNSRATTPGDGKGHRLAAPDGIWPVRGYRWELRGYCNKSIWDESSTKLE